MDPTPDVEAEAARTLATIADEVSQCRACPRLVEWRERVAREKRAAYADQEYWGRGVPGWGDPLASVAVVGLARQDVLWRPVGGVALPGVVAGRFRQPARDDAPG